MTQGADAGQRSLSESFDFVIVGSGFGGSVSAFRLAQKGYKVLVLEKGRRWSAKDFPKTNWNLPKWMWLPIVGFRGFFKMTFFRHVTILSGVGVGGGSLVYANTLPVPKDSFFTGGSWAGLADWKNELEPHYTMAKRMLGAAKNPRQTPGDRILGEVAAEMGLEGRHEPTEVAVYFGEPGVPAKDPYFEGEGPDRTGCIFCGACMTGCRHGAKNTLDKNYLYLAEKRGVRVEADTEVEAIRPQEDGSYCIEARVRTGLFASKLLVIRSKKVVFSGGVLGTVPLLLKMKEDPQGLPRLSDRLGDFIRTNNEALLGVVAPQDSEDLSEGIAITSILNTGDDSHIEPVRYGAGSGFFRLLVAPHAPGPHLPARLLATLRGLIVNPVRWFRALTVWDFARHSQVLLYMQTFDSTLKFRLGRSVFNGFFRGLVSKVSDDGKAPTPFLPEATKLTQRFADKIGGVPMTLFPETLMAIPTTAHVLGGCCIGEDISKGVINVRHEVHDYPGLYVIDGSSVSANPGVNPSLTITAMAERAMAFVPQKVDEGQ